MGIMGFNNYRDVIEQKIVENRNVRGYKSLLADHLVIQRSYFSQILSGKADLTPDHAAILADHWQLDELETDYFGTLVNLERAQTPSLRERLKKQLELLSTGKFTQDPDRPLPLKLDIQESVRYYSQWEYSAVHAALHVPQHDTVSKIASFLNLTEFRIEKILAELQDMGLALLNNGSWEARENYITTPSRKMGSVFHSEIRHKAKDVYVSGDTEGFHYAQVFTLSNVDFLEFRLELRELVKKFEGRVMKSELAENVSAFTIDFFKMGV
ncbi:MAG: TIGR02147 family protein [Chitinophagaceae bacterium]|nr:TIGR02147 family protein [Oligoflexus sp.]